MQKGFLLDIQQKIDHEGLWNFCDVGYIKLLAKFLKRLGSVYWCIVSFWYLGGYKIAKGGVIKNI